MAQVRRSRPSVWDTLVMGFIKVGCRRLRLLVVLTIISLLGTSVMACSDDQAAAPLFDDSPELLEIPSVVGMTVQFASGVLSTIGSPAIVEAVEGLEGVSGTVVEQLPRAGALVTLGSPVVLKVPGSDVPSSEAMSVDDGDTAGVKEDSPASEATTTIPSVFSTTSTTAAVTLPPSTTTVVVSAPATMTPTTVAVAAPATTAPMTTQIPTLSSIIPGRMIIKAPINPTAVAPQRRASIGSPRIMIASIDPRIGRAKAIEVISANGIMVAA